MALERFRQGDESYGYRISVGGRQAIVPAVSLVDSSGNPGGAVTATVAGDAAAGAADSGNPVKVGGVYTVSAPVLTDGQRGNLRLSVAGTVLATLVDAANNVAISITSTGADGFSNSNRQLVTAAFGYGFNGASWDRMRGDSNGLVVQSALSANSWVYAAPTGGIVNTATAVTIKAAAGASVRNYLRTLEIAHDLLGAATELAIRDGAGGTVLWRGKLQTPAVDAMLGAGSIVFDPPLKGTANTLLEVVTLTAVTGGVFVNAQGYTGA